MSKKVLFFVFVVFAMIMASCGTPTASAPVETAAVEQPTAVEATVAETTAVEATTEPVAGEPEVCATDEYGCAVIPAGSTVKLGMGAPMTGDYASFGVDISQGATIAVQDAGQFEGFSFELVAQDTQGTPEGGAAVANKLVTDPTVVAIPGHIFSGSTEAAMPIYEKAGLPMLSPSATNPPLTTLGSKVFNRIAFTDAVQGKFAAEYLYNTLGFTKIAVMHDGGAYGQGLADVVKTEFTALGGEVVGYEAVTPGEQDYTPILSALASANPQAIYFGGYVAEGYVIANQMKQTGLENAVFFGCDGTFGAEFIEKGGANAEGAYAASVIPPESEAKTKFDAAYLAAYGVPAGSLSPYTWSGYDSAAALIAMVEKVAVKGEDGNLYVPRGALVNAVRTMSGVSFITGDITCNEVGECNTAGPTFYVVQDGQWVEAAK
jgi:branched-chain amino acid transport system substrate-binding protein